MFKILTNHTHTHTHRSCKESCSKTHTWGDARNADKRVWISNPVVRGQGGHVYINREFEILNSRLVLKLNMTQNVVWVTRVVSFLSCLQHSVMVYGYQVTANMSILTTSEDLLVWLTCQTRFIAQGLYSSFLHLLVWLCHTYMYRQAAFLMRAVHAWVR